MAGNNVNIALVLRAKQFVAGLANAQQKLTVFGATAKTVGRTMQYALGGALLAAGFDAAKAAAEFDLANAKLEALGKSDGAVGIGKLADTARELGKNSIFTAAEVSKLQLSMKKLGLSVDEVDNLSESVVKFATAMDVDAEVAGSTLIKTMNKFKGTFDQYTSRQEGAIEATEMFANATLNSALNFETLQYGLGYAGGEANAAGFSFAKTAAVLGKLADAGFEGSRGGVILRKVLQSVGKKSNDVVKEFDGLIKSNKQFNEVLKIVGVRAAGGTLAIGGMGDEIKELEDTIQNQRGGIDLLFGAVDESLIGRLKNLRSAIQEIGITLLDKFGDGLSESVSKLADWVRSIDEGDIKLAKFLIGLRVAAGVFNTFQGFAITAAKGVSRLVAGFASLNPAGIIITGLVAGMLIAKNSMDDYQDSVDKASKTTVTLGDFLTKFYSEDGIYSKIEQKGFESRQQFIDAVSAEQAALGKALSDLQIKSSAAYGDGILNTVEAMFKAGKTFSQVVEQISATDNPFGYDEEQAKNIARAVRQIVSGTQAYETLGTVLSKATLYQNTYWKAVQNTAGGGGEEVKKLEGVIDAYERLRGAIALEDDKGNSKSSADIYKDIEERIKTLQDVQTQLNDEKFREQQYNEKLSDDLQKRLDDNKLLLQWLNNYKNAFADLAKLEENAGEKRNKNFVIQGRGFVATREQMKQQIADAQRLSDIYGKLPETMQGWVDKMKEAGYTSETSIMSIQSAMVGTIEVIEKAAASLGQIFAEALVDPATDLGDALRDAGRQFLIMAAAWVAKIILLTGLIALGNALTQGGLSAFLQTQAKAGNISNGTTFANNLAQSDMGMFANFRTTIAGPDLVTTTGRGMSLNSRLYG